MDSYSEIVKHDSTMMLDYHRKLLLKLIRKAEKISRAELTKVTKLSPTTVGRIVGALMEEGLLNEVGTSGPGLGRKARLLALNGNAKFAIGLDIDLHTITAGIVNLTGEIITHRSVPTEKPLTPEQAALQIKQTVEELLKTVPEEIAAKVAGLGVCLPGNVQWPSGTVRFSPQLGWSNVQLGDELEAHLGDLPIFIENNVKSSATAEILFGHGKACNDFVVVHVGSGIGSAVVKGGAVERGENGMLGEIGHIVVQPMGRICDCGRRGCMQAYACISALEKEAGLPFKEILKRAAQGDLICSSLLEEATSYIAMLISNIVNMYDPPLILLTGEMFDEVPSLAEDVKERAERYFWHNLAHKPRIEKSTLKHLDNMILSAASVVFQESFFSSAMG